MPIKIKQMIALGLLMLMGWYAFEPGLTGGFLLDDEENISHLGIIDNDLSGKRLVSYFAESNAGPLKRPIPVFSFLLDAQDWPAAAYPFKRTNLIIHMLNGALLFGLLLKVFNFRGHPTNRSVFIAALACAVWTCHPFLVSTVLYVVQRMAMLPLTFMLTGMWWYLHARHKYHISNGKQGKSAMFLSVYLMTLLAMLSKENGAVLVWLIALFEVFIVQRYLTFKPLNQRLSLWLLKLPGALLLVMLLIQIPDFISQYESRTFSVFERLLSQTRALTLYLYHWFVPTYITEGVFTDGFKPSYSLISPISTFFSCLFILALTSLAWLKRKQWVWFSFAVFFFLLSQVLESTFVPLELYYEHRMYVSSVFLGLPLLLWCFKAAEKSVAYLSIPMLIVMLLMGLTWHKSELWGNHLKLHQLTIEAYPESVRAKVATAVLHERSGNLNQALQLIDDSITTHDNLELKFSRLSLLCLTGKINPPEIKQTLAAIDEVAFTHQDLRPFINLVRILFKFNCLGEQTTDIIFQLSEAVSNNSNNKLPKLLTTTHYIKAQVHFQRQQYLQAKDHYLRSFEANNTDYQAMQTAILQFINAGEINHAEELLNRAEQIYLNKQKYKIDWSNTEQALSGLRKLIGRLNQRG